MLNQFTNIITINEEQKQKTYSTSSILTLASGLRARRISFSKMHKQDNKKQNTRSVREQRNSTKSRFHQEDFSKKAIVHDQLIVLLSDSDGNIDLEWNKMNQKKKLKYFLNKPIIDFSKANSNEEQAQYEGSHVIMYR